MTKTSNMSPSVLLEKTKKSMDEDLFHRCRFYFELNTYIYKEKEIDRCSMNTI